MDMLIINSKYDDHLIVYLNQIHLLVVHLKMLYNLLMLIQELDHNFPIQSIIKLN